MVSVGDLIDGRYRIEELIARGGQASVWRASQEQLQRTVALKVLTAPPTREGSEPFRERFLLEAKTLASLNHPNIVVVYDYGRIAPGCYYIAMEYVEGVRFSRILRKRPIDAARRLRLVHQVCGALRYAHQRGVIHRDVKNANILVRQDSVGEEEVKVVDFGIVKLMESDPGITQEGVILGSPHFMAPEQIVGAFFDHRADIYAVGVLLYCSVTGRYPYRGKDARKIMTNHLRQPIPEIKSRDPRLVGDEAFAGIVKRCLAKRPDNRFSDMDQLLEALAPYASGERFTDPVDLSAAVLEELVDDVEDLITGRTERGDMSLHPLHDGGSMTAEMGALLINEEIVEIPAQKAPPPIIGVFDIQDVVRAVYDPEDNLPDTPVTGLSLESEEINTTQAEGIPVEFDDEAVADEAVADEVEASESDEPEVPAEADAAGEQAEVADEVGFSLAEPEEDADEGDSTTGDDAVAGEAVTGAALEAPDESQAEDADAGSAPEATPTADAPQEEAAVTDTPADNTPRPPVVVPELDEPVSDTRLFKLWIAAFAGTLILAGVLGRIMGWF